MTDLRAAAEMALEFLEHVDRFDPNGRYGLDEKIDALIQALAQPEQEPVAWISDSPTKGNGKQLYWTMEQAWKLSSNITPLYTSPPNKQKQEPVTLESVYETIIHWDEGGGKRSRRELARRIVARYAAPLSKQEPVAWVKEGKVRVGFGRIEERKYVQFDQTLPVGTKLYTAPLIKPWVSLTDDDRIEIFNSMDGGIYGFLKTWGWLNFSEALEAKLKDKNT